MRGLDFSILRDIKKIMSLREGKVEQTDFEFIKGQFSYTN